jgi:hypothetical protein
VEAVHAHCLAAPHPMVGSATLPTPATAAAPERQRAKTEDAEKDARDALETELLAKYAEDVQSLTRLASGDMCTRMCQLSSAFKTMWGGLSKEEHKYLNARLRKFKSAVIAKLNARNLEGV